MKKVTTILGIELEVGKHYILDKNFNNKSEVIIVNIYGKMFCRIKSITSSNEWDVMCNRLTPIE